MEVYTGLRVEVYTGLRLKHGFQQRSAFRRPAKKTDAKRVEEEAGPSHTEASEAWTSKRGADPPQIIQIPKTPPRNFGRLVKPLVFTVGVRDDHFCVD